MTNKNITISDIARRVGVSKTTISRYLNGSFEFMSEKTKGQIEAVIRETGYSPSITARTLKAKKSSVIGVITHTLSAQVGAQTINAILNECNSNGYTTAIYCSNDDPDKEAQDISSCISRQVDGMIIIPATDDVRRYEQIEKLGVPVVLCTRVVTGWSGGLVYVNHEKLIGEMVEHLAAQGFEKALFLMDEENFHKNRYRKAFLEASRELFQMEDADATAVVMADEALCWQKIEAFRQKFSGKRLALFALNTNTLFLILKVLKKKGVNMPEDFGVCGYDAVGWAELVSPGISSVRQPMEKMGETCGKMILQAVKEEAEPRQIQLDGELYFRKSTGRI